MGQQAHLCEPQVAGWQGPVGPPSVDGGPDAAESLPIVVPLEPASVVPLEPASVVPLEPASVVPLEPVEDPAPEPLDDASEPADAAPAEPDEGVPPLAPPRDASEDGAVAVPCVMPASTPVFARLPDPCSAEPHAATSHATAAAPTVGAAMGRRAGSVILPNHDASPVRDGTKERRIVRWSPEM
jgi:hypothetical protein